MLNTNGGYTSCNIWCEDWTVGVGGTYFTLYWNSGRGHTSLGAGNVWNASGYDILNSGHSIIFGDYTPNRWNDHGSYQPELFSLPWTPDYYVSGNQWLEHGTLGQTADYESSMTTPDSLTNYDYGAVTDHCVTLMGYVLNGKAVPSQYIVGFTVSAIGSPSADTTDNHLYDQIWSAIPPTAATVAGTRCGSRWNSLQSCPLRRADVKHHPQFRHRPPGGCGGAEPERITDHPDVVCEFEFLRLLFCLKRSPCGLHYRQSSTLARAPTRPHAPS